MPIKPFTRCIYCIYDGVYLYKVVYVILHIYVYDGLTYIKACNIYMKGLPI